MPPVRENSPHQGRNKLCMLLTFTSATRVSDNGGERPALAWEPHPATWKEWLRFASVQGGSGFWCCFCFNLFASEAAPSSVSEILIALCGVGLLPAFFSGESAAMAQRSKLGLTVPFKRGSSAHPIRDCTTPINSVAWFEQGNWDFCLKHCYLARCPNICGSKLHSSIVCFSLTL